ncbi:MAG: hypothetical protein AB1453_05215 [Chloroflexota bacterium]|jgi:hypothetical protein
MTPSGKDTIKRILGNIPFTAELYWLVRQRGKPLRSRFSLRNLQSELPEMTRQAAELQRGASGGKKIFIFATLHYWIEHAALVGMALAAQGHKITLGYLPYADWQNEINRFDLRRQNAYARKVLDEARPLMESISFVSQRAPYTPLPADLAEAVREVSTYDAQYTLQAEDIDPQSDIYKLRSNRNREIAQSTLAYLRQNRPNTVIIPNGTIQELGVVYRVARHLKLPVVTYEFSDQRQRIWLAHNSEVMRQDTGKLWEASKDQPLRDDQLERMRSLMMARQRASMWENFARLWQGKPAQGGEQARKNLGLDARPVVLLATNVLGDSLTLGRQVFSKTMADWISRTVQYFIGRPDVQLIIRIHPGEVLTHGQSMAEVVQQVLPRLPENIRLIRAQDEVNTYDLIEVADVGLVYTTTVGLEMAMVGLPVVVAGQTHYRDRGFTCDPDSWVTYFKLLGHILENPRQYRLSKEQVNQAWQYAYRFFFDYPQPFPWHLVRAWEDYKNTNLTAALTGRDSEAYRRTFAYLAGSPINWDYIKNNGDHG